jgi:hypothetical protein
LTKIDFYALLSFSIETKTLKMETSLPTLPYTFNGVTIVSIVCDNSHSEVDDLSTTHVQDSDSRPVIVDRSHSVIPDWIPAKCLTDVDPDLLNKRTETFICFDNGPLTEIEVQLPKQTKVFVKEPLNVDSFFPPETPYEPKSALLTPQEIPFH